MIPPEIEEIAKFLEQSPTLAAKIYADTIAGRAAPLVDNHFTHGGQGQYNFAPLSAAYQKEKEKATISVRGGGFALYGKTSSQLSTKTQRQIFAESGRKASQLKGGNLPILVRSGKLRSMVTSMHHVISQSGDTATITFKNLPEYAIYLHEGTQKMPARSPVMPGPRDIADIKAELQKRLSVLTGSAKKFGTGANAIAGLARLA